MKKEHDFPALERISVDTAKLLKELNFNWWCTASFVIYNEEKIDEQDGTSGPFGWKEGEIEYNHMNYHHKFNDHSNENYTQYPWPRQEFVKKWLREVYFFHIIIIPTVHGCWTFKIINVRLDPNNEIETPPYKGVNSRDYETYEEALEAGLQEALKLIK